MKSSIKNYFDKTVNFNSITRFLHQRKYDLTKQVIKNDFGNNKLKILDIGCGTATMFGFLKNEAINFHYTGIEPQKELYSVAENHYSTETNFNLIKNKIEIYLDKLDDYDLILAMDTLEHIPLNSINKIIENISNLSGKKFLINVPNEVGPILAIKNLGSYIMRYPRFKEYDFFENIYASTYNIDKISHHIDAHKGFDWRHLLYTLNYYYDDNVEVKTLFPLLPKTLSPSVFFICN